jgi:hypothetical protein
VVTFEPRPDGRIYERTPDGTEHDWGEVLAWEPPNRLAYLWHLGTHRGWERLGPDAAAWRERNLGGWSGLLPTSGRRRRRQPHPPIPGPPNRRVAQRRTGGRRLSTAPYARARTSPASTSR